MREPLKQRAHTDPEAPPQSSRPELWHCHCALGFVLAARPGLGGTRPGPSLRGSMAGGSKAGPPPLLENWPVRQRTMNSPACF